jgi:hypothetical protein
MTLDDDTDARELYTERAAIMEFDGGLRRHEAEYFALVAAWRYCDRTGANPPALDAYRLLARHFDQATPREPSERATDVKPNGPPHC